MLPSSNSPFSTNSDTSLVAEVGAKYCIFQCGESQYALSATALREITHASALVRVPHCPQSLAGICHIRSEFVPVVFLNPLLGDRDAKPSEPTQLLVLSSSLGAWALMIDRVIAIDSLETHVDAGYRNEGQLSAVWGRQPIDQSLFASWIQSHCTAPYHSLATTLGTTKHPP